MNTESSVNIEYIGIINTPFKELQNMPIQPKGSSKSIGEIVLNKKYLAGLKDLETFSHIYLIYHFHKTIKTQLQVVPFMDNKLRGVFSTRSPLRPSHIGMSLTKILSVEENIIKVEGIDILDKTPLLDIKPYIAKFEDVIDATSGWMSVSELEIIKKKSDKRFI